MEWEKTITAVKKTRLRKPKTVALVGFAANSRTQAPYEKRHVEIWGCNEAYVAGFMVNPDGEFRVDRWFQIHKHEDFSRENNSNDERHYEWLQREHNFPVYMQEKFEEIPNAKKLPLAVLEEEFFSNLYSTIPTGASVPWLDTEDDHGFFTSSFAYMMAMAIYEGFEKIEIWGFNMGTQSEYALQAPGGTFWISAALNRGIDVVVAGSSPLMRVPLYGYEFGSILTVEDIRQRISELGADLPSKQRAAFTLHGARQQLEQLVHGAFAADNESLGEDLTEMLHDRMQEELEAGALYNFWLGGREECRLYLQMLKERHETEEKPRGWMDRLTLEVRFNFLEDEVRVCKETLDLVSGATTEVKFILASQDLGEELTDYLANRGLALIGREIYWTNKLNWHLGAQTQVKWFMLMMDSRQPNQIEEKDFGQVWVPDLYPSKIDLLMLDQEMEEEDDGETS